MQFPNTLENLMLKKGISLSRLAKDTGISKSSLHGFLNGAEPTMSKIKVLADYFQVSMDYLSTGKNFKYESFDSTFEITIKKVTNKD